MEGESVISRSSSPSSSESSLLAGEAELAALGVGAWDW